MIHYIKGVITETMQGMVVIENNGIGYEVYVPDGCPASLSVNQEVVTLYTAMIVREDDVSLYGFSERESLKLFYLLMTVSGVGAKAAMAVLSALSPSQLRKAIAFEDVVSITKANGIGKKTAQRIVLELKDKIDTADLQSSEPKVGKSGDMDSRKSKAAEALMALGFTRTEAMTSLMGITDESLSVEEMIRNALKNRM